MAGVVIIGAGQAAVQAAASLRQNGYEAPIALVGSEPFAPYQRPPLSKTYLLGDMDRERLFLKPDEFYAANAITLDMGVEVESIDADARRIRLSDGRTLDYATLILATGARPRTLASDAHAIDGVLTLRTLADADLLRSRMHRAKRVAVVGGGYIGLEVAAAARKAEREVVVIEAAPRLLSRVSGAEIADFYARVHRDAGVDVRLNASVKTLEGDTALQAVVLEDGTRIEADLAVVGIGVTPNEGLAADAGLPCDNGVMTDEAARTAHPDIYAIGDCARAWSPLFDQPLRLESVQNAIDGAKAAAAVIAGSYAPVLQTPWNWSDQYDLKLQIAGVSTGCDATIMRGDTLDRSFAVFYLRDRRLIGCDAVNAAPEFLAARQMIAKRARPVAGRLADTHASMKDIAATS